MKESNIKQYTADPKRPYRLTAAEKRHLDAAPIDYSDMPELEDAFFEKASRFVWPGSKVLVKARIDADVVAFAKKDGKGYQTRLNAMLRMAMDAIQKAQENAAEKLERAAQRLVISTRPRISSGAKTSFRKAPVGTTSKATKKATKKRTRR